MFVIVQGLIKFAWWTFKWGLLAGIVGLAISIPYLFKQLDNEIRRRIETKFAQHYANLKVSLRHAELVKDQGIQIRDLSILDPAAQGPRAEIVHLDEVFLQCCVDLDKLVTEEPEVTRVVVRRPAMRITRAADGSWSVERLLPLPKFGKTTPEVVIENGTIEICDPLNNPPTTWTLRDVNLKLTPAADRQLGPDVRKIEGSLGGDHLQRVQFEGLIDTYHPQWNIAGSVDGLQVGPEMRSALPAEWSARLRPLGSLRGLMGFTFRVVRDPDTVAARFEVAGRLSEGRWDNERLPHPLTDLQAEFRATERGFAVQNLGARCGQSSVVLNGSRSGYRLDSPLSLQARVRDLNLDPQLAQLLPESMQAHWQKYQPAGTLHADLRLEYDGAAWHPEFDVECLETSFSYARFPYRVEHARGTLNLKGNLLTVRLTGYSSSQPIHMVAEVYQPLSMPYGWFTADANNIPLDDKLLAAVPEPSRRVIRSLDPHGSVNVALRVWRDRPEEPLRRHMNVALNRCWVKFEKFPYPLSVQHGTLEMRDGAWTFHNLTATNESGFVTCKGRFTPILETGCSELFLNFEGVGISLNEQLRDALRPEMQHLWKALRPQGIVDLDVKVRYTTGQSNLDVEVRAEPRGLSTSIEPVQFPYRFEKLRGVMHYHGGQVTLESIRAEHGHVQLSAAGQCEIRPDGGWRLRLEPLVVDRIRADRELVQALPERLKKAVLALNLNAPANLSGTIEMGRAAPESPLTFGWDVGLHLAQASLDFGLKLENLHGGLRLLGGFDGQHVRSRGELKLDCVQWKNFQFTDVMGPLWIDDEEVRFGAWVEPPKSVPAERPRSLTAQLLSGTVTGDVSVKLAQEPSYRIRADLAGMDLARMAKEHFSNSPDLRGVISASVDLTGSGRSLNGLGGGGTIQLREADIYESPLMVRLLRLLAIRRPNTTAFSSSDVNFRIQGMHIYLDRIDFNGDTLSLIGQGDMNFQTELHLQFQPQVGHGRLQTPVFQRLLGGASRQLMVIYVNGTLQDPQVTREAFPGVNRALQQIQGEGEPSAVAGAPPEMDIDRRRLPGKQ